MARKRMINPSIWADRKLMECSFMAQILFIGMFSNADDHGRLPADARDLRRLIFGFRDVTLSEVDAALEELRHACKSLVLYEAGGERYAAFLKWEKYQYVQRPTASEIPAPPEGDQQEGEPESDNAQHVTGPISDDSDTAHGGLTESSRTSIAQYSKDQSSTDKTERVKTLSAARAAKTTAKSYGASKPETLERQAQRAFASVMGRNPYDANLPRVVAIYSTLGPPGFDERLRAYREQMPEKDKYDDFAAIKALEAKPKRKPWERAL